MALFLTLRRQDSFKTYFECATDPLVRVGPNAAVKIINHTPRPLLWQQSKWKVMVVPKTKSELG